MRNGYRDCWQKTALRRTKRTSSYLEASEKQVKDLTTMEMKSIHQLRPARQSSTLNFLCPGKVTGKSQQYNKQREKDNKPCHRCGEQHSASTCRFKMAECRYCHKIGHIAAVCFMKKRKNNSKPIKHVTVEQREILLKSMNFLYSA